MKEIKFVQCPDCRNLADVEWTKTDQSTDGPIEMSKVRCVQGHWFMMPSDRLKPA